MPIRSVLVLILMISMASCGGGDRHLPSSNPPEYDPKKVSAAPVAPPSTLSTSPKPTQSTEFERLKAQLESLEAGQRAKGEGKKVPFDQNSLQLFKGVTNPCEALSRLAPGLGSTYLFEGTGGAALKKALGPDADGIARRMNEHIAEGLKHSLDPSVADCPISVRPRKSSRFINQSQPPRIVLAHTTPDRPLLLAQTTVPETSQDDYEVQKSSSRENPPPDWVGYKTTDTMTRIGKKPHTEGIREHYEMIIAPKAKRCPDPEGMVEGTFEWSFVMFRATTGPQGEPHGVLYRRHVTVELKGKVGDDAKVQYVDFDATVAMQHIGTELPYYSHSARIRGQFTLDQRMTGIPREFKVIEVSDFSAGEVEAKDASLMASITLIAAYFSGLTYFDAQTAWHHPNTCVEITFTPATRTKKFTPNESVSVKTELRTKKEHATVPATFKEAKEKPREGNGVVSPKQTESIAGSPATFTYTMPGKRVKHSGFWVGAVSRAGVAEALNGEWELADGGMRLRIANRIWHDPGSPYALSGYAQFDGTVQFEIQLERVAEGWFRGEIMTLRPLVVRHVRPAAHPCAGSGSQTEHWQVSAHVDHKTESMVLHWGFTDEDGQASWTCTGPAGTWTDQLTILLFSHDDLHTVQMPTKTGTKKDLNGSDKKFLEWLSVEVVEGIDEESR